MRTDETIHFNHIPTHPNVVYAPMHVMSNAGTLSHILVFAGAFVALVAAFTLVTVRRWRAAKVFFGVCGLLGALGFSLDTLAGSHVGALPSHSYGIDQSTPGDQSQMYLSKTQALQAAQQTSREQHRSIKTARAVAYQWGQWPADAVTSSRAPYDTDDFPADAGWSEADSTKLDAWVAREYGAHPVQEGAPHQHFGVVAPGQSASPLPDTAARADHVDIESADPGNDNAEYSVCAVEMSQLRLNDLSQPISATPKRLVCASQFDSDPAKPHLYYPRKRA